MAGVYSSRVGWNDAEPTFGDVVNAEHAAVHSQGSVGCCIDSLSLDRRHSYFSLGETTMSTRSTFLLAGMCFVLLSGASGAAAADQAFVRVMGDWEKTDGGRKLEQHFRFANDVAAYGLTYLITVPDGTPPGKCTSPVWAFKTKDVTLGMGSPVSANWYTQAFSSVRIDGLSLHDIPGTFRVIRDAGPDALVEGTWETPKGPFSMRLLLRGGDDKLLVQYVLPPENSAKQLEVRLMAYPHDFRKPWDRHMATATRDIGQQSGVTLDANKERWALFYDQRMWKEKIGGGPCGFVYTPEEVEPVRLNVGPYSVAVHLRSKPNVRRITVGLWDFTATPDVAGVRTYLRDGGEQIANDFAAAAKADWLSATAPTARLPKSRNEELTRLVAERRKPTPFDTMTGEVVTPYVGWAKPLDRGAVRTLVVAPRWSQRETVELAQRLDLDYQTVSLAGPDELFNARWLYLYNSYDAYGYKRKNEIDVLDELSRALAADHECKILSGFRPSILPKSLRETLIEKVRGGTGLVLVGYCRDLLKEFGDSLKTVEWNPHVVPLDRLPVLDKMSADGRMPWRAFQFGKGRVLAFDYSTGRVAFTPSLSHEDPDVLGYYDYYHSLVAAGVLWAAGREPTVRIRFADQPGVLAIESNEPVAGATLEVLAHDPARQYRQSATQQIDLTRGANAVTLASIGLPGGPRFVSVWIKRNGKVLGWGTGWWDVPCQAPQFKSVQLPRTVISPEGQVAGTVELTRSAQNARVELELWDTDGRLLEKQSLPAKAQQVAFRFSLRPTRALLLDLQVRLFDASGLSDQVTASLTVPNRSVDDFHFLVWSSGQNQAVRHFINRQLAAHGVDWIDNTGLTGGDRLLADVYCRNAAKYGLRSVPYITRISSAQESGRERRPCLHDPSYRQSWTAGLQERATGSRAFGPPAYTLGDENFLVNRHLDVCIAEPTLVAFRIWLKQCYGTIEKLNDCWRTTWTKWDDVMPATFDEVKDTPEHWPRWADHRQFMDRAFTEIHALGREAIRRADPDARVGFDGVFTLDSWHGYDFYQLNRACDLVQVYASRRQQVEYLRCWHVPDAVRGAWYNHIGNTNETSAKWLGWHLLLHGMNSSWYWTSYNTGPALLFPDLRPAPQFLWMQESIDEIKAGIGRLLLSAKRQNDGIAVHYSQASVHAGTLTERRLGQVQWGMMRLIEDLGLQYQLLSYEQIANGELDDFRVLFMPASAALTPQESVAIRRFANQGGLVIADTLPGWLDNHCRVLDKGQLDDMFGIRRSGLPNRDGNTAIRITAKGLQGDLGLDTYDADFRAETAVPWASAEKTPAVLVRDFGKGRAVVLNTDASQYESLRAAGTAGPIQQLMLSLLDKSGVRPQVRVLDDQTQAVPFCEIVRYADGGLEYVAIVQDHSLSNAKSHEVTVALPKEAVVFDVRNGRRLGKGKSVQTTLDPGDPLVLALFPCEVDPPVIKPLGSKVKPGDTACFEVTAQIACDAASGHRCLHVEAICPDGNCRRWHTQNVLTDHSKTQVSIPLALNAPSGEWKLRVKDVATGKTSTATFHVAP